MVSQAFYKGSYRINMHYLVQFVSKKSKCMALDKNRNNLNLDIECIIGTVS